MRPQLVHARKAKLMMGCINMTDRLDVRGLNRLQRAGTLPTVWIPPEEIRLLQSEPGIGFVLGVIVPLDVGAVARHLAEATYWILMKREPCRDPCVKRVLPTDA
ncbi:MAG TPA: hypothetical protein VN285_08655 [Candidatus Deferrimicrobium sp.]|nr:hypothetical protein [Candidatus Deferrimicrobium sp.]